MPFTFAHPAIVLPFATLPKKWFSATGLVIGSMIPDFEYFIRMSVKSVYSHTTAGIFWFDLPLAIIVAFIYHNVVRDSLLENLPAILKTRVIKFKGYNWNGYFRKYWFTVMFSILLGCASHILWDNFTHENGFFVQKLELTQVVYIAGYESTMYQMLQHLSTIAGGIVIMLSIAYLPKTYQQQAFSSGYKQYWLIAGVVTIAIVIARLLILNNSNQIGNIIVSIISGLLASLILSPMLLKKLKS